MEQIRQQLTALATASEGYTSVLLQGSGSYAVEASVKQYQNAEDTRGRLVMSCMTPATDGTFISIDDEEAKQFRESV
ncbi:hypothetical protein MJN69_28235, partial [Salmonella enterica subsp. enterica serovar Kentucky]|nr:hypothetical protein [Salmonella enterica subsp. enterica serovar Kentucky]